MLDYAKEATVGIKFDLKKFYHEIDIAPQFQTFAKWRKLGAHVIVFYDDGMAVARCQVLRKSFH